MPVDFLSSAERARLQRFPETIASEDLITYFTLTEKELELIGRRRGNHNRLGFALQLCALRYLGYCPEDLFGLPKEVLHKVARQLERP